MGQRLNKMKDILTDITIGLGITLTTITLCFLTAWLNHTSNWYFLLTIPTAITLLTLAIRYQIKNTIRCNEGMRKLLDKG